MACTKLFCTLPGRFDSRNLNKSSESFACALVARHLAGVPRSQIGQIWLDPESKQGGNLVIGAQPKLL